MRSHAAQVPVRRDDDAASPWMGSTRKAHVFGVMARSSAAASPKGTSVKPGVNGPKPSRYCASVEKLTIEMVRPWKLLRAGDDLRLVLAGCP